MCTTRSSKSAVAKEERCLLAASGHRGWRRPLWALALGALLLTVAQPLHAQESKEDLEQFRAELSEFFTQLSQLVDRLPDRPVPQISDAAFAQAWALLRFQPETVQLQINSLTLEDLATLRDAMNLAPHWQDLAPRALTILEGLDNGSLSTQYTTPISPFPAPNDSGANKTSSLDLDEPARTFCDAVDDDPASPGSNRALLISCDVFKGTCVGATIAAEAVPGCPDDELALPFGALVCLVKVIIKTALQIVAATLCSTRDLTCGFAASDSQCSVGLFFNGLKVMLDHRMDEIASEQSVGLRAEAAHWGWCMASSFASCNVRTDCGLGEACVANQCVTIHTCQTDADCGAGGVCFIDPFATQSLHAKLQNRLDVPVTSRATEDSVGVRAAASMAGWCRAPVDQSCGTKADCEVGQACVAQKCVTVLPCATDTDCEAPATCVIDPFVTTNLHEKLNQRLDVKLTTRASEDSIEGQRGGPPIDRSISVRTVIDRTNDVTLKRIQEKVRRLSAALTDTATAMRELQERSTRFAIEKNLRLPSSQTPIILFAMPDWVTTPPKSYCSQSVLIECASNTDCPPAVPAERCVANQCTRACAADEDCIRGGTCTAGSCVECAGDTDCPNGRFCISGTCLSGQVCTMDAECPELRAAETCITQPAGMAGMLPKVSRIAQDVVDMTRSNAAQLCGEGVFCENRRGIDNAQTEVTQGNVDAGFHTLLPTGTPHSVKQAYVHYRNGYRYATTLYGGVYPTPTPGR
jgi:Cys-rich repeat protein